MDETFANMREELLRQIAGGINLPAEIPTGLADLNHWCVDDKTEVLTRDGWKTHDEAACRWAMRL
ncbi:MAG: hypothetical protein U5Q03_15020 [Bacteroidota bacterium]|nr:hypothetical protein [Bacteroidota bacterium]